MTKKLMIVALCVLAFYTIFNRSLDTVYQSEDGSLYYFTLSNDMPVYFVPNRNVAAVNHTLWLRVGAADEAQGKTGLAHYLEHLLFKGTNSIEAGEYSRIIESVGGQHNAFTGQDFTGYYATVAVEHLEKVMQLEADRMQHLTISDDDWREERDVVMEEYASRVSNRPSVKLRHEMLEYLYGSHPYATPVIGIKSEIDALTREDAMAFYKRTYHPANMVLVVTGNLELAELKRMAEKYYGNIPAGEALARDWPELTAITPIAPIEYYDVQVKQPSWRRIYKTPSMRVGDEAEVMPLMLAAQLLGGGRTSLLYKELVVQQQIATSASANYSGLSAGPGSFSIYVTPREGVSMAQVGETVDALLAQFVTQTPDAAELARAKTLFNAEAIYARDGLSPLAMYVGQLAVIGANMNYYTDWESLVDSVDAKAITQSAKAVLRDDRAVTGHLLPEEMTSVTPELHIPAGNFALPAANMGGAE